MTSDEEPICENCDGTGKCPACDGTGEDWDYAEWPSRKVIRWDCVICDDGGKGRCKKCGGEGVKV